MALTPNQELLLRIANKDPEEWHSIAGVCCVGRLNGRGMTTAVRGLVKAGLIDERVGSRGLLIRIKRKS